MRSEFRITKVMNCDIEGLKWRMQNVYIYSQYPRTLMSVVFNVTEDIRKFNKVGLQKCIEMKKLCQNSEREFL